MLSPASPPDAAALIRGLTGAPPDHAHFVGEPIDLTDVDLFVLGDVWSVAEAIDGEEMYRRERSFAGRTAEAIVALRSSEVPQFRGSACRDYVDLSTRKIGPSEQRIRFDVQALQKRVCFALARCPDLSFDGLRASAERLLAICPWVEIPHLAVALDRISGSGAAARVLEVLSAELASSPFFVDELRVAAALPVREAAILADVVAADGDGPVPEIGGLRYRLSGLPGYADFAPALLRQAAERVEAIHRGDRAYAADKAFTSPEAKVVGRCLRVALDRDESWAPPVLESLFPKVCVAPTSAKTMPSQAVAIAVGQAVEAYPTPEAVAVLRKALRVVRHAGVEKKLQRSLRAAEKGLAGRLEIALRLTPGERATKAQLTTLARALEATFVSSQSLRFENWRSHLAGHPSVRGVADALIWRIIGGPADGAAVLPIIDAGDVRLETVDGRAVAAGPGCGMALWHPADATGEERDAWRDVVAARSIRQPFKQAFREHYAIPDTGLLDSHTAVFAGHVVSLRPLLGLARREGWRANGGNSISRPVGRWTATLAFADEVHPGATGWTTTGSVGIWSAGDPRWVPARFRDLSAVVLSEVLRSVDLLVGTSAFATTPAPGPTSEEPLRRTHLERLGDRALGPMADMRKQAIGRILAGRADMEGLRFEPRHLRLGAYAIHLATGRVTRDGDPVTVDVTERLSLAAVPWLPYDEKLLESIVHTAIAIAHISGDGE